MPKSQNNQYREALEQIAEIVATATGAASGTKPFGHAGTKPFGHADIVPDGASQFGCVVKPLPAHVTQQAARHAMQVNPLNAPTLTALAMRRPEAPVALHIAADTQRWWGAEPREFTVSFMESTPADLSSRIVSHLNAWSDSCGMSFVETRDIGQVRISRGGGGYYSYLGTDIDLIPTDQQTMNLEGFTMSTEESEFHRVVRHEAGHTLGFPHEHMRSELVSRIDPGKAYPYFWRTQGWDQTTVDQQVLTSLDEASLYGTPVDEDSVMCYQLPGEITFDGLAIRGGVDINQSDYDFAAWLYPPYSSAPAATGAERGRSNDVYASA